jgi:hypothetical protein
MIRPGRAGAGCTQFPFFMRPTQKLRAASDELAESQVSAKRAQLLFYAAGTCIGLRFRLATSQASSRR